MLRILEDSEPSQPRKLVLRITSSQQLLVPSDCWSWLLFLDGDRNMEKLKRKLWAVVSKSFSAMHLCQRLTSDRFQPRTQLCWKMGHWAAFVAVRPNVYPISLPSTSWDPIFQRVAYCNSNIMSDTKHVVESSSKFYVLKTVGKQGWKLKTLIIYDHLIHRSIEMTWFALICHCMAAYCCGSEERWFGVATFGVRNPQLGGILERSGFNGRNLWQVMWMIYNDILYTYIIYIYMYI